MAAAGKKAKIIAYDLNDSEIKSFSVLFNPNKYTISKGANYDSKPGAAQNAPSPQYASGSESTLSMELFFDTYGERTDAATPYPDVRTHLEQLRFLMDIYSDDHKPPKCTVMWGSLSFDGYLSELEESYTLFSDEGIPVRATASVKFIGAQSMKDNQKKTSLQSSDRTKERVLKEGDQLWSLAATEYGDPSRWRSIAEANGIDNPRKIKAGQPLIVPSLE